MQRCMSVQVWTDRGVCVHGMPDSEVTATCGLNYRSSCFIIHFTTLSRFIEPEFVHAYQVYDDNCKSCPYLSTPLCLEVQTRDEKCFNHAVSALGPDFCNIILLLLYIYLSKATKWRELQVRALSQISLRCGLNEFCTKIRSSRVMMALHTEEWVTFFCSGGCRSSLQHSTQVLKLCRTVVVLSFPW